MKKIVVIIAVILFCGNVFSQGINFEHGTFTEALAKAKAENKMVFMDCYTSWCGPCKALAKNVFPQKDVGAYFNAHFVSVKIDMEKGEGVELQKQYDVKAFPTLLFMDASGKVIHKLVGGTDAEGLIEQAKIAADPSQRIGGLESRYSKGDRDVKLVAKYIKALKNSSNEDKMLAVGNEFIANAKPEQYLSVDGFTILAYTGIEYGGKEYTYLIKNKKSFVENEEIGLDNYDYVVGSAIENHLNEMVQVQTLANVEAEIEKCKNEFLRPNQEEMEKELRGEFYLVRKKYDEWFDIQEKSADALLASDEKAAFMMYMNAVHRIAMDRYFNNCGIYDRAIEMAMKAKDIDDNELGVYFCLAVLHKKEGNKQKALENINTFIKMLTDQGEKLDSQIEKLKKEIESM